MVQEGRLQVDGMLQVGILCMHVCMCMLTHSTPHELLCCFQQVHEGVFDCRGTASTKDTDLTLELMNVCTFMIDSVEK